MNKRHLNDIREDVGTDLERLMRLDGPTEIRDRVGGMYHRMRAPHPEFMVVMLNLLDGLRSRGVFDPSKEAPPDDARGQFPEGFPSWLPVLCENFGGGAILFHRAMLRALVRWGDGAEAWKLLEDLFGCHFGRHKFWSEKQADDPWCEDWVADTSLLREAQRASKRAPLARVLLPCKEGPEGSPEGVMVQMTVTAVESSQPCSIRLAPWSFFEVQWKPGAKGKQWDDPRPQVLQALAEVPPPEGTGPSHGVSFLVACSPLGLQDFEAATCAEKQWATWGLTPGVFVLAGSSLGLPLLLAAWASLLGKSLHPIIATGELDAQLRVKSPGDFDAKREALLNLLKMRESWKETGRLFVAEKDRRDWQQKLEGALRAERVVGVKDAKDPRIPQMATDGFDDHRKKEPANPPEKADHREVPLTRETYAPPRPAPPDGGEHDHDPLARLKEWVQSGGRGRLDGVGLVTIPEQFGIDPAPLAQHLEYRIWQLLYPGGASRDPGAADRAVVLRVAIPDLLREPRPEQGLPAALRNRVNERAGSLGCSEDHIRNALRAEGKLLLILHDAPSDAPEGADPAVALWHRWERYERWTESPESPRYRVTDLFVRLSQGRLDGLPGQAVLFVCSDLHHEEVILEMARAT